MKKSRIVLNVILCIALVFCMSSAVFAADTVKGEIENGVVTPVVENSSAVTVSAGEWWELTMEEVLNAGQVIGVPSDFVGFYEQTWVSDNSSQVDLKFYYGQNIVARATVSNVNGAVLYVTKYYAPATFSFSDTYPSDWYYGAVKFCYDYSLMNGTSLTAFDPNATTTRAMLATIIWRLEGSPAAYGNPFNDLTQDWYKTAVIWAAQKGIVNGYGNGKFGPDDPITREQMATMLYRYAGSFADMFVTDPYKIYGYNDFGKVSSYAFEPLQWACSEGMITGMPGNTIQPGGNATRAQMATILERFVLYYFEV